ncbi:MAG: arsenite efflux transporter metallochaperone ArsD [Planctomycetaceae bacterium]|nr:arsenite efflux transporter metallochaperone ArsD [Planctomycetales bacterium]MCB9940147.1 arsenite efflux transporter metallochaperone ArsD [Planctomycetaceae bacterium]
MAKIEIYDKPMCCSTGICGPEVDPILPRFAADLDWLKAQGHQVERSNLAQQPAAFAGNASVREVLAAEGVDSLPLIVVDGTIVSRANYPSRDQLEALANGTASASTTKANPLGVVGQAGGCCGDTGCC